MSPTIDQAFFELMPSRIIVNRFTGEDAYGNNQYSNPESFQARIDSYSVTMASASGDTGTVAPDYNKVTTLICDYVEPPYSIRDKVTLPDGRTLVVATVDVAYDENGPYHLTLSCADPKER